MYGDIFFLGEDLKSFIIIFGVNKFLRRIKDLLGFGEFILYDFWCILVIWLFEEGVVLYVIEKMLGYEFGGVFFVYNKYDWIVEQKDVYDLYVEKIFWYIRKIFG